MVLILEIVLILRRETRCILVGGLEDFAHCELRNVLGRVTDLWALNLLDLKQMPISMHVVQLTVLTLHAGIELVFMIAYLHPSSVLFQNL